MKEKAIKTFGLRMETSIQESQIPITNIHDSILSENPPWTMKQPEVMLNLNEHKKNLLQTLPYSKKNLKIPSYVILNTLTYTQMGPRTTTELDVQPPATTQQLKNDFQTKPLYLGLKLEP